MISNVHTYRGSDPCNLGMSWVPSWKSLPNSHSLFDGRVPVNPFTSVKWEIASFALDIRKLHAFPEGVFSPYMLFSSRTIWPLDIAACTLLERLMRL